VLTTRDTGRLLNFLIIGVLAVALGLFALDRFVWDATPSDAAGASVETAKPAVVGTHSSIAVLPFVNLSNDPEQEFFSDGIAEELMSALARFKALKVAARTSAFSFKGKQADLREVGLALNVGTVLEGSVRKSGDHLRITAQLSDVATGYQLWSETYDRKLTDIFAIQDDITTRIVSALQVHLDEKAASTTPPQLDPEAYQIVLRGRFHWNERSPEGLAKAAELLQEATRRAPQYARLFRAGRCLPEPVRLRCPVLGRIDRQGARRRHQGARTRRGFGCCPHLARAHTAARVAVGGSRAALPARDRTRPELHPRPALVCALPDRARPR
jgi:TolB-like protein